MKRKKDRPSAERGSLASSMLFQARSRLVNICLIALLGVGLLVLPLFIIRIGRMGWNFGSHTHFFIVLLGIVLVIFRRRFSLKVRTFGLLGIAFLSAVSSFLTYGIVGSGFFGMGMLACTVAALVLGRWYGILVLALGSGVFLGVMAGVFGGSLTLQADIAAYLRTKTAWFMALSGFVLPVLMLVLGIDEMHRLLRRFINDKTRDTIEIEEKNAFLESLLNTTNTFFVLTDPDLKITRCNDACLRATGYNLEEILNRPFPDVFLPEERRPDARDRLGTGPLQEESEWSGADGRVLTVSWNADLVHDNGGNPAHLLISGVDVSEQKALQRRVSHAEKLQSIGELAGGVAHDFNNMLAGMITAADLLAMKEDNPSVRELADIIIGSGKRAASLTRKLLDFSRLESGPCEPLDANRLVLDAINLIDPGTRGDVAIRTELTEEPLPISGDAAQLMNAVINLGLNAGDAMPDGGTITITTSRREISETLFPGFGEDLRSGSYAVISVADTGTGMDRETLSRIFEPFFTTKEPGKGTGLGLASVYGSIRRHNGAVRVYSEPGEGTVFHVYLPCNGTLPAPKKPASTPSPGERPREILLADDDPAVRTAVGQLLEACGHRVVTAASGEEALRLLEDGAGVNLVILDWIMPGMGGRETFVRIRKRYPELPLIVISGFSPQLDTVSESFRTSPSRFLGKPFQKQELLEIMDSL